MSIWEGVRIALAALAANKMRSALTTLGVVIGVAAVIAMVALGQGAQKDIQDRINRLGSNLIYVAPGQAERGRIFRGFGSAETLTIDDAQSLRDGLTKIAGAAPEVRESCQVKYGSKNNNYPVIGTFSDYSFVRNADLAEGRFFTRLEESAGIRVAVLGSTTTSDLFGEAWPLGKRIKVKGASFTVVGVLNPTGGFGRQDQQIFIPLKTFQQRIRSTKYVSSIALAAKDGANLMAAEAEVKKHLRRRHRLRVSEEDDFSFANQQDIASTSQETSKTFTLLLAGIASISLIVGGIGIMNIMLVTVTERTREIGIRKALGARRRDIQIQFLIESIVLSVLGGLLGVALGVWTAHLLSTKFGLTTQVAMNSVVLSFGCAAGIGIFFGFYPANRAGRLDPIQALRYE